MSIWKMTFCFYLYSSSAIDIIVKRWIITVNYSLIQLQCACFDRVAKIETLKRITADASQKVELGFAFNTLGGVVVMVGAGIVASTLGADTVMGVVVAFGMVGTFKGGRNNASGDG